MFAFLGGFLGRQQCHIVNTRNERKRAPLCTWGWHHVVKQQYRAREEVGVDEDGSELSEHYLIEAQWFVAR